ncbi:MAG: glycoside hydrolase family 43 protein [Faecalibacterium sp.]|nr:glycoside hydrolase family 43 protein [Faecalibacterium sp.]
MKLPDICVCARKAEARIYNGKYYIYATQSALGNECLNIDLYVSEDGESWEEKKNIIDMTTFPYATHCIWAPSIIEKNSKYYLIFAVNDIQNNDEDGGLEIAVSDKPEGPFENYLGTHLVHKFINGAQPIDAHFFKDDDGTIYLFYGGWDHCNVAIMNDAMDGFVPFENGECFKEITPNGYHEAPCMFKRNGKYYFMWSSGSWTNDTYHVSYGMSDKPIEMFKPIDTIIKADYDVAKAPGHNGYFEDTDGQFYIVYHRRPLKETDRHSRILAIDKMNFDENEKIIPIKIT